MVPNFFRKSAKKAQGLAKVFKGEDLLFEGVLFKFRPKRKEPFGSLRFNLCEPKLALALLG